MSAGERRERGKKDTQCDSEENVGKRKCRQVKENLNKDQNIIDQAQRKVH